MAEKNGDIPRFTDNVLEWALVIVNSVTAVLIATTLFFSRVGVVGESMENTLFDGDRLVISWFLYKPEQGDIVICDSKELGKLIVKRVIAVGGQKVTLDYNAGTVSVDGEVLDEPYLKYHALENYIIGKAVYRYRSSEAKTGFVN